MLSRIFSVMGPGLQYENQGQLSASKQYLIWMSFVPVSICMHILVLTKYSAYDNGLIASCHVKLLVS